MRRLLALTLLFLGAPLCMAQSAAPLIVIDPGHGGRDVGIAHRDGPQEKVITHAAALRLAEALESEGFDVRLTRHDDSFVSFHDRQAAGEGAALLLSIHVGDPRPRPETIVFIPVQDEGSRAHARRIGARLMEAGIADAITVREASFHVLRGPAEASVILALGVSDAPEGMTHLTDERYLGEVAAAVASALRDRAF